MKSIINSLLLVTVLSREVNAWSTQKPKQQLKDFARGSAVVAASIFIAGAATAPSVNAADFTGSYSDPNHPNCARLVAVEDGNVALISGADGNPGCPTGEGNPWKLVGKVSGDNIYVDFSPKGGPKDLEGVWEIGKGSKAKAGIRWPDGNKWFLEGRPN